MALDENERLAFRAWLISNELDERIANAILDSMAPYDWHEQATRTDVAAVQADVAAVQADVAAVKTDVAAVQADVVRLDKRFDTVDHRFDLVDQRFEYMESQFGGFGSRLDSFGTRLDSFEGRIDARLAASHESMDRRFDSLTKEMRVLTFAIIGFMVTMAVTFVGGAFALL